MKNALRLVQRALRRPRLAQLRALGHLTLCERYQRGPLWATATISRCFSAARTSRDTETTTTAVDPPHEVRSVTIDDHAIARAKRLPAYCPGCGAPSQIVASEEAGFYNLTRGAVRSFLQEDGKPEDEAYQSIIRNANKDALSQLGLATPTARTISQPPATPICDRCHNLLHHSTGVPILHPSMTSIKAIIEESPHQHNHIYHVLDAADFPLSLIPSLQHDLRLPRLRTQNRRSKSRQYTHGRTAEVSFIITRSDLLAPRKEDVDGMMAYLREVLRDALGRSGRNVRLGNVRCVSAKRGWWTKEVKEDIWRRGGAGWMVGKVNVGKSSLFEVVFPKGRGEEKTVYERAREQARKTAVLDPVEPASDTARTESDLAGEETQEDASTNSSFLSDFAGDIVGEDASRIQDSQASAEEVAAPPSKPPPSTEGDTSHTPDPPTSEPTVPTVAEEPEPEDEESLDLYAPSLLPPAQTPTAYPFMPISSSLPGTTASPIRIPFGSGGTKGELIDLPGIYRSDLSEFVRPDKRDELVMKSRISAEQVVIKPGQSLVLGGGLVRITPVLPLDANMEDESRRWGGLVVLAWPFVPVDVHVTATEKARDLQSGERGLRDSMLDVETCFGTKKDDFEKREDGVQDKQAENQRQSESVIRSAGTFSLKWDVTKKRAGPLTDPTAVKLKAERLPFVVWSADVVIEGLGWVELVAQTRKPRGYLSPSSGNTRRADATLLGDDTKGDPFTSPYGDESEEKTADKENVWDDVMPRVEVFTPRGKFVGVRAPMNASLIGARKKVTGSSRAKARPRKSMRSVKLSEKGRDRQSTAG